MRRFLTIGITGKGKTEILHGAANDRRSHIDKFNEHASKKAKSKKSKSEYAEVQVIDLSRGVVKRKRFDTVEGSGKRTIARTIKKRATKAKKAAVKRAPKKAAAPKAKAAKKSKAAKTPKSPKKASTAKTGDEGLFPPAKPAAE